MSQINEPQLIKVINEHGTKIATLEALVVGLFKHIKSTQGNEGVHSAAEGALEEARLPRPAGATKASATQIQRLRDILLSD